MQKTNINIPNDKNLNNDDIEKITSELSASIADELYRATPIVEQHDTIKRYITPEIKNLQKLKSRVLSEIHKLKFRKQGNEETLHLLKLTLNKIKKELYNSFNY